MSILHALTGAVLTAALVACIPLAAMAQSSDPMAAAVVTGSVTQSNEDFDAPGELSEIPGGARTSGFGLKETWESSDPRLSGEVAYLGSWHYYFAPASAAVAASSWQVANSGGSWKGTGTAFGSETSDKGVVVLQGSGGYAGLSAYLVFDGLGTDATFEGLIFPGEMPVAP
jgi:hypothetical protein